MQGGTEGDQPLFIARGGWVSVEDFGGRVTNFSGGTERGIVVTNNRV